MARNWKQFKNYLKLQHIRLHYKYKSGTDEIRGVSFSRDDIQLRGSAIDRSLSFANIDKQLKFNQQAELERQSTVINTPSEIPARSTPSIEVPEQVAGSPKSHSTDWFGGFDFGGGAGDVDEDEAKRKRKNYLKR